MDENIRWQKIPMLLRLMRSLDLMTVQRIFKFCASFIQKLTSILAANNNWNLKVEARVFSVGASFLSESIIFVNPKQIACLRYLRARKFIFNSHLEGRIKF